ncbi:protein mono-ADP-ribosyltransferase TIPARP-like [Hyperolius riggenbachi]|uniref:protein mono-ADP-ribosyltransferase TIPARP-like n=1 Tax=Hyperolius riggenbachi TaxID=752182 RepID=UPI0035A3348D
MLRGSLKRRRSCSVDLNPAVITGLDPTQEEIALQELDLDTENTPNELVEPQNTPYTGQLVTFNPHSFYIIYQEDGHAICSDFLVGPCSPGLLCPKHHTVLPYLWQLRYKDTKQWWSFDDGAQLVLERLYSDPSKEQVTAVHQGSNILIDLTMMAVHQSQWFDLIRRLSTSTRPEDEFHTIYKYYYEKEDDKWEEYSPDFMKCIEEGIKNQQEEVLFSYAGNKYSLHLVNLAQTNVSSKTVRRMRRRPEFRSPVTMCHRLRSFLHSTACPCPWSSTRFSERDRTFPKSWCVTNSSLIYEKSLLKSADTEYVHVYTKFHRTMAESKYIILEISRIQNYFQWENYFRKKLYMEKTLKGTIGGCLERYLFHGTSLSHIEGICNLNFDPRVSGKNGTLYGKGSYFARDASYSHGYSPATPEGHHFMFLAKVLVGRPALGKSSYNRPPPLNGECESSLLYDSCVDKACEPTVFIVFDRDQFYPYFLIKYQKLENLVLLD